jgi:hypothetical protein
MIMDRAAVCAGCPNVATADERRSFSPGDTMTNVAGGILLGPAAAGRRRPPPAAVVAGRSGLTPLSGTGVPS